MLASCRPLSITARHTTRRRCFQVLLPRRRLNIACGAVRVAFYSRRNLSAVATRKFNTPRGAIAVSTPEATAIDLVGYHHHVGGFDNVATVLAELAEQIDAAKLVDAAQTAPLPWAQRLGYLLDHVGAGRSSRAVAGLCESTCARLCATSVVGRLRPSQTRSELEALDQ
jgi:predicted transcriptional regulator of viral defense system